MSDLVGGRQSSLTPSSTTNPSPSHASRCTLHVCTSCRLPGTPRNPQESSPGYILYQRLSRALEESHLRDRVELKPAACLSICPRPCGVALSEPGSWTYLFGDQQASMSIHDILECIGLFLNSPQGLMPRGERPESLRSSILGRVPPSLPSTHAPC